MVEKFVLIFVVENWAHLLVWVGNWAPLLVWVFENWASVSQKVTVNKFAREALSLITTDLRNTGYYHVDFESTNCSKLNNAQIEIFHSK